MEKHNVKQVECPFCSGRGDFHCVAVSDGGEQVLEIVECDACDAEGLVEEVCSPSDPDGYSPPRMGAVPCLA